MPRPRFRRIAALDDAPETTAITFRLDHVIARFLLLLVAAASLIVGDISLAHAQSAACNRLFSTLDTLDRNSAFRESQGSGRQLQSLRREVQRAESAYVRDGCNADAKAGRRLSPSCRALADRITSGRDQVQQLEAETNTGDAVAQQREAILQEIARFGCSTGQSHANVNREQRRGNIFEQLFGGFGGGDEMFDGEGGIRGEEFDPFGDFHTVRTLCVRKADGYYWPISYSTLTDYLMNDMQQCQEQCPGVEVDLYYYDNPGQEPEQMVNVYGEAYTALPNAFKFRESFDLHNTCKPQVNYGSINLAQTSDGASRAMITFEGKTFPLPLRDPRRRNEVAAAVVETAQFVSIPLPRRRPAAPGEAAPVTTTPAQPTATESPEMRVVQSGDKRIRIVGPDTPYAQAVAAGT